MLTAPRQFLRANRALFSAEQEDQIEEDFAAAEEPTFPTPPMDLVVPTGLAYGTVTAVMKGLQRQTVRDNVTCLIWQRSPAPGTWS